MDDREVTAIELRPRLLVVASTYPRWYGDHEPGFVHELSRRLAVKFDVHVVCPHAPGAARLELMDGVSVHRFRYAPEALETLVQGGGILTNLKRSPGKWAVVPFFFLGLIFECLCCIRQIRPDCIHSHWIVPQGLALAILSLFKRSLPPVLLTSHGGDLFGLRGRVFRWLKRWTLSRANAVTVVSSPMATEAIRLGVPTKALDVIPMGVDFSGRFSMDSEVSRVAGRILFVGRLVEKKGVKYLLTALPEIRRRVPDAHLVIVGGGPEMESLSLQVRELGLSNSVEFLGPMAQDALPDLYRRASVFVAPFIEADSGDQEGLGLVTVEAIACGCPVVVGNVPVVADIFLDSEVCMRATPGDPKGLAEKVTAALLAPDVAVARALAVRERLAAQMGWDAVASRYVTCLQKLAGISGCPSVLPRNRS